MGFTTSEGLQMRRSLGLRDDADEATIIAALDEALAERAEESGAAFQVPDGMEMVPKAQLEELREANRRGSAASQQLSANARDRTIEDAIAAGRATPAQRANWVAAWNADSVGTQAALASLPAGLVPTSELGTAADRGDGDLDDHTVAELDKYAQGLGIPKEALRG